MPKKILPLLVFGIMLLGILGGGLLWKNFGKTNTFTKGSLTPELALQKIIQKEIKQEFWPEKYEVITEGQNREVSALGLGRRFANNYAVEWFDSQTYFLIIAGFDKNDNKLLNGYSLNIVTKGISSSGKVVAEKYLKNNPQNGWLHNGPKIAEEITSSIDSVFQKERAAEDYIRVLSVSSRGEQVSIGSTVSGLPEVTSRLFPNANEIPKEYIFIHKTTFFSNHPRFGTLQEVQKIDQAGYK